ncbi:MAG: hypothetical protein ABIR56_12880, partial [Polaromonas sp.]
MPDSTFHLAENRRLKRVHFFFRDCGLPLTVLKMLKILQLPSFKSLSSRPRIKCGVSAPGIHADLAETWIADPVRNDKEKMKNFQGAEQFQNFNGIRL